MGIRSISRCLLGAAILNVITSPIIAKLMNQNQTEYNKAIILEDQKAIIVNVEEFREYDDNNYQIQTEEGLNFITAKEKAEFINDTKSEIDIEDYIRTFINEEIEIEYLEQSYTKRKVK